MVAVILFNGLGWLLPAAALVVAGCGVLWWGYRNSRLSPGWRLACIGLKALGLLALALCLLEPLWVTQRPRTGANLFLLLGDNSMSLQIHDPGQAESRGGAMRELLSRTPSPWQDTLAKDFQVRRYGFDSRLQRLEGFSELTFDGKATALGSALRAIRERFEGQPLAGILLFSDGNATDLPEGLADARDLPPIYPVVAGNEAPARDLALAAVAATQTAFEDAPVTASAEVVAYGCAGEEVLAQLLDISGRVLEEKVDTARGAESRLMFRFQFKPEKPGLGYYRVRVAARVDKAQFEDPTKTREATLENNLRAFVVDRGQEPYRVLYVTGRPNWEYKFLNRALAEDSQVQVVALIRVARREPKFDFRGRAGEQSNPLFRGFGNTNRDDVERYDQPVLVRLNTRDAAELQGGFPKTPEELFSYHAIILDDLEAGFFTPEQMQLVQKFVSQRGGGLLMLGGAESFHQGHYERTPIGDLLPVYMDTAVPGPPSTNNLKLTFTREGMLQPWARLRAQEGEETQRLESMPGFMVLNRIRDFKPGATVIATVKDDHGSTYPAIATQRFGNGRSAAVMVGDLWRWGMKDAAMRRDLDKSWRQLVRWLVSDVPPRIDVQVEPIPGDPNQAVSVQVRARDKAFQPLDNAHATLTVIQPGATGSNAVPVQMVAEASAQEPGLYEATFIPRQAGAFEVQSVVTGAKGVEEGKRSAGWAANVGIDEFQSLKPNLTLLDQLARKTGGERVAASNLERFVETLPGRKAPLMETSAAPLWHRSLVFLTALACFVLEWGLRRWKGLP